MKHRDVKVRALTDEERKLRKKDIYDSFANYITYCEACGAIETTNMYIMSAEARVLRLKRDKKPCPVCNKEAWAVGYPKDSRTGFGVM